MIQTFSIYATDTITIADAWNITVSGRYNRTTIRNRDALEPGGGSESLDGDHRFSRFNPAAGVTFSPARTLNIYGGYSEGSRAATSIELGCANPEEPCKLPNAMAGYPPLDQVVTRTWEAGARGEHGGVSWSAGLFRSDNRNDILFVMSDQTGFGYFRNFGETRRKGFDLSASRQFGRFTVGTGYTFLAATYESEETVNGESNSSNDRCRRRSARPRRRDRDRPGDRIPLIPRHQFKASRRCNSHPTRPWTSISWRCRARTRGERKQSTPGRRHVLISGRLLSWILGRESLATYRLRPWMQIVAQITNLFDRRYYTAAQLGVLGFTNTGAFVARPIPAVGGEFPLRHATFYAPGAPIRMWIGTRFRF